MRTNLKPASASWIASLLIVFNQLTAFQEVAILHILKLLRGIQ